MFSVGDKVRVISGDREIVQFCEIHPAIVMEINGDTIRVQHGPDSGSYAENQLRRWPVSFTSEYSNGDGWYAHHIRFETRWESEEFTNRLLVKWTLANETRIVESADSPNYRWIEGIGLCRISQ